MFTMHVRSSLLSSPPSPPTREGKPQKFKGRYVYENFGADTAEGYGYSSEAQPLYSWGALAGFIGLQANGFYAPQ